MGDASAIMVAPANIYYGPTGEAIPDETSVAFGAAWGGNWVNLGYTLTPLAMGYDTEMFELEVEQIPNIVKALKTKETITFEVTLAELTALHLKLAMGGSSSITTSAAGASQHAFEDIKLGGEVLTPEYAWGFEGYLLDASNHQMPVRLFIYKGSAVMNGNLEFSKKAATGIPLQITALADTTKAAGSQILNLQRVTGWKTSG